MRDDPGSPTLSRRVLLVRAARASAATLAGGALSTVLAACGQKEAKAVVLPSGLAAPGTTIPSAHINWAMAPFPDETLAVIGMNKGYFKDVGIDIGPTPRGAKIDLTASLAPLLSNQVQVGSGVIEVWESELDNTSVPRTFVILDTFEGYGFFAPPGSKMKTLVDFMNAGQTFEQAIRSTMAQLKGKKVALATDPAARLFYKICLSLGGLNPGDMNRSDLQNSNILEAALAGKTDIAAPSGGVEIIKLKKTGFKTLVDEHLLLKLSNDARRLQLVSHSTYVTRADYYAENYPTILRAASVIYRILDELRHDHAAAAAAQLPFLNAYTGTKLTESDLAQVHKTIAVLRTFDEMGEFLTQPSSPNDIYTDGQAQIDQLVADKVLKHPHKVAEVEGATRVWLDLHRYRDAADKLKAAVGGKNAALAAKAQAQYNARNYLDAYRFYASIK